MAKGVVEASAGRFDTKGLRDLTSKVRELAITHDPERERVLTAELRQKFLENYQLLLDSVGFCQTAITTIRANFPYTVVPGAKEPGGGQARNQIQFTRDPKQFRDLVLGVATEVAGEE